MGELGVRAASDAKEVRAFTRVVLRDIRALELMIERGLIEDDIRRIGVEQEMYLVGADCLPAPCSIKLLETLGDPRFTTELARFNLEANFDPQLLGNRFLRELEQDLRQTLQTAQRAAESHDAHILLTGILPTLRREDLGLGNMTPELRYQYLNDAVFQNRGAITVVIDGIEQYEGAYDSVVLEGANTSLQLHLQVSAEQAVDAYNLAQLITAPLLASATNSPVFLGRRLWHETRVAVFERSLDTRSDSQMARGSPTRVSFGDDWVRGSFVDIFRDNLARFPIILIQDPGEDPDEQLDRGEIPKLKALQLHNGTIWRWNRPCYGITDGKPHLRVECRVLPAGPTVIDEAANAALFYGLMVGLAGVYGDFGSRMPFAHAKANFLAAAQHGLQADLRWVDGRRVKAVDLLTSELLPAARQGLKTVGVPDEDLNRYLGTVEERVKTGRTGSSWLLDNFAHHRDRKPGQVWVDAVTAMLEQQALNNPVHAWELAEVGTPKGSGSTPALTVGKIMTTDLFTVRPDDVIDLAASVMDWKHIRHVPVETDAGQLIGVLTARDLLRLHERLGTQAVADPVAVKEIMSTDYLSLAPETPVLDAMKHVLEHEQGCLLVTTHGRLLGIVTERDLVRAAHTMLT